MIGLIIHQEEKCHYQIKSKMDLTEMEKKDKYNS